MDVSLQPARESRPTETAAAAEIASARPDLGGKMPCKELIEKVPFVQNYWIVTAADENAPNCNKISLRIPHRGGFSNTERSACAELAYQKPF